LVVNNNIEEQKHLRDFFANTYTEVHCSCSISQAITEIALSEFALIIIDASFTENDSIELVEALQQVSQVPILILSLKGDFQSANTSTICSQQRATNKYNVNESLLLAKHLMQMNYNKSIIGEYCYTLAFGNELIIEPEKRQAYLKGKKLNLTRKEFDVLLCLASNPGKVLTREQIYSQIWEIDTSFNVDDLVKAHIKTLRKKLADSDIQYIKNVWGVGYRFDHETEEDGE